MGRKSPRAVSPKHTGVRCPRGPPTRLMSTADAAQTWLWSCVWPLDMPFGLQGLSSLFPLHASTCPSPSPIGPFVGLNQLSLAMEPSPHSPLEGVSEGHQGRETCLTLAYSGGLGPSLSDL